MAWTTPRTWNQGETVTSAIMNVHVRDNLNYLKSEWSASGWAAVKLDSSGQVITTSTWTQIEFDTVVSDDNGWWDSSNYRFVLPSAGIYLVQAQCMWDSNTGGDRWLLPAKTGSTDEWGRASYDPSNIEGYARYTGFWSIYASEGDYLGLWVYQNSGSNRTFQPTSSYAYANQLAVVRII